MSSSSDIERDLQDEEESFKALLQRLADTNATTSEFMQAVRDYERRVIKSLGK